MNRTKIAFKIYKVISEVLFFVGNPVYFTSFTEIVHFIV